MPPRAAVVLAGDAATDVSGQRIAVALHAAGFDVTLIAGPDTPDTETLAGLPCVRLTAARTSPGFAYRALALVTGWLRRQPPAGSARIAHRIDRTCRRPPHPDAHTASITAHLQRTRPDLVAWTTPGWVTLKAGGAATPVATTDTRLDVLTPVITEAARSVLDSAQADRLHPRDATPHLRALAAAELHARPRVAATRPPEPRPWLRIGNANSAGLPRLWGDALMQHYPRVLAETTWLARAQGTRFGVDEIVRHWQWTDPAWQDELVAHLRRDVTHVLTESGRPVVGTKFGKFFAAETGFFAAAGIRMGLVFHGSDIRDPARHRALEPFSPFHDATDPLTRTLQARTTHLAALVSDFTGPKFVTTCDLFDYLPDAMWLPVTVDWSEWVASPRPFEPGRTPVVLHAPTNSALKGSDVVDEVCTRLAAAGHIEYVRPTALTRTQFSDQIRGADIVVDQLRLGDYGLTAVEAMAAGRVVIGHVSERVRRRLPEPLPIAQATPPEFEAVLSGVLADIPGSMALAQAGRDYARTWHDGRRAAAVLAEFAGLTEAACES